MKAKLKTLKRGQTFYGAGIQWLVLGHTNSSQGLPIVTHIVSTGIVERRAFDEKNRNDLGVSTLLAYLNGEFLERLEDAFGEGAVAEQFIDLTSNDGLKDYGNVKAKVGLLTEKEYRQHRDILPPLGDGGWWWLATPYSTERAGCPSLVRRVNSGGTLGRNIANGGYHGVRPALYLKSDISVSLDGNDESTIEVSEEELYKAAVRNPDAIPTLPHPSGWVSVNERLPSEEIDVLLLVRETEYYGKHGEKRHVYRWVFSGWNIDGEWATTYCHGHKMLSNQAEEDPKIEYKVTHWMPLPDPPEEVTNNAV